MSDLHDALEMLGLLSPEATAMKSFVIAGKPPSKARPRLGKGGRTYSPDASVEEATAWQIRAAFAKASALDGLQEFKTPHKGPMVLGCIFYRPTHQRIDVDNMLKHVMDASTKARVWEDDSQVISIYGTVRLDPENPRTVVVYADCETSMRRGGEQRSCKGCGAAFEVTSQNARQRYCSQKCRYERLAEPVPCPTCGTPFKRRTTSSKFCSAPCLHASRRGSPRGSGQTPTCSDCGKPVSKSGYERCRECWKQARADAKD